MLWKELAKKHLTQMKTELTPIPCIRLTVYVKNKRNGKWNKSSKICHTAEIATDHYVKLKHYEWWSSKGCLYNDNTYERADRRMFRLRRRALKIFQQYLP